MSRLAWKRHLTPVVLPPEDLFLLGENTHHIITGAAYVKAAPLLDGSRSDDEIHAQLEREGIPVFAGWLALGHLRALGALREINGDAGTGEAGGEAAFREFTGEDGTAATGRLNQLRVTVLDSGGRGGEALRKALPASGVQMCDDPGPADLAIAVIDDFLDPRLEALNLAALENRRPWMALRLAGTVPWIGPIFVPGKTACWACLAQRLRLNRQTESFLESRFGSRAKAPLPALASSLALAAEFAVVEVLRWLAIGHNENLEGGLLTLDLKTNGIARHTVVRRPQCPVCGDSHPQPNGARGGEYVELLPSPKKTAGGRSEPPKATLARLEHHISPITGPVRSLSESNQDGYLHVSGAQAFPMYQYNFRVLRENLMGRSGGKGLDPTEARACALCEALERYSGTWHGEERGIRAATSHEDLGGEAIDPATLFGYSARQYAEREAWNATNDEPNAWVPKPFDDSLPVEWVAVRSMTQPRTRFVPAAYCYYGHPELRHMFCSSDSNGCAAGSTFAEAVAHGFLELIERDAAAIWWYNRCPRPAIDVDSFCIPAVDELRNLYRAQGREFWALDITNDIGVPVVVAVSARMDSPLEDIIYGFGSDLDPTSAVNKAVLEMNQSLFAVFKGSSNSGPRYRTAIPTARRWFQTATRANQPYLVPDAGSKARTRSDFACRAHADWRDDAMECVERLSRAGIESFVLDQSRPDIGLPVCRVLAPGLCHFWRRFGHRRLYEIPVRMGWQRNPKAEDELNPWFIYF